VSPLLRRSLFLTHTEKDTHIEDTRIEWYTQDKHISFVTNTFPSNDVCVCGRERETERVCVCEKETERVSERKR